jgi:hypothetical protein
MTTERIFADYRLHAFGESIETTPHVGRFRRQPDPRPWRAIQHLQTRQADHASISRTDSRRCR